MARIFIILNRKYFENDSKIIHFIIKWEWNRVYRIRK
jgi:hypothetical protein